MKKIALSPHDQAVLTAAVPCGRHLAHVPSDDEFDPARSPLLFMLTSVHVSTDDSFRVLTHMIGVTQRGKSIAVKFHDFRPFFYLRLPDVEPGRWLDNLKYALQSDNELPHRNVHEIALVYRIPSVGFVNMEKRAYAKFSFDTVHAFYAYRQRLTAMYPVRTTYDPNDRLFEVKLCEASDSLDKKFIDEYGLVPSGWVRIPAGGYRDCGAIDRRDSTRCAYLFDALVAPQPDENVVIPALLINSFDIETSRGCGDLKLSQADNIDDPILSIGCSCRLSDFTGETHYVAFIHGSTGVDMPEPSGPFDIAPDKITLFRYATEPQMLLAFMFWLTEVCVPDVLTGYFINRFDLGYVFTKLTLYAAVLPEWVFTWGKLRQVKTTLRSKKLDSKAIIGGEFLLTKSPGIMHLDLYDIFSRDTMLKLPDLSLNTVCLHFLKRRKDDISFTEIDSHFYGTAVQRGKLLHYNMIDTDLVMRLIQICGSWSKFVNMSRVNRVFADTLYTEGQGNRVYGGMHYQSHRNGFVIDRPHKHPILDNPFLFDDVVDEDGSVRADWVQRLFSECATQTVTVTVKHHQGGTSSDTDVLLSQTELTPDSFEQPAAQPAPGEDPKSAAAQPAQTPAGRDSSVFGVQSGNTRTLGVFARGPAGGTHDRDAAQEREYMMWRRDCTIEAKRRKKEEKKKATKKFQGGCVMRAQVGLHDNVMILDFNSLYPNLMLTYNLDPTTIVLDTRYANIPGVSYLLVILNHNVQLCFAQTGTGIMLDQLRHLIASRKRSQARMKAADANRAIAQSSMRSALGIPDSSELSVPELIDVAKVACASPDRVGSCAPTPHAPSQCTPDARHFGTETVRPSAVCRQALDQLLTELILLHADYQNFNSLQNEEKISSNSYFGVLSSPGKIYVPCISACVTSLGRRALQVAKNHAEHHFVVRSDEVKPSFRGFLKDIATETTVEHENATVKAFRLCTSVVYGDTDSIFVLVKKLGDTTDALHATFDLAQILASQITMQFPRSGTMRIVHEKTAGRLALYSAKCYALTMFTKDDSGKLNSEIQIKGLQSNKRDTVQFARNIGTQSIKILLLENLANAVAYVKRELNTLLTGDVDPASFVIYKKLCKASYDQTNIPGHAMLARRMAAREPATAPKLGQEVKFLYVVQPDAVFQPIKTFAASKRSKTGKKMSELIEDVATVVREKLDIDLLWYLQNQIYKVLDTNFRPFLKDAAQELMRDAIAKVKLRQHRMNSIFDSLAESSAQAASPSSSAALPVKASPAKKRRVVPSWAIDAS